MTCDIDISQNGHSTRTPLPINTSMVRYDDINYACRPEYCQAHSHIIMCESLLSAGGDLPPMNSND